MNRRYVNIALRFIFVLIAIVLSVIGLYFVGRVIIPFIIAFLIALFMNPMVNFFQQKLKRSRTFSVLLSILLVLVMISAIISLAVNEIIQGFVYLSTVVPAHFNQLTQYFERLFVTEILPIYEELSTVFKNLDQNQKSTVLTNIEVLGTKITLGFSNVAQAISNGLYRFVLKLPNMATMIFISLLATFFISKDWYVLKGKTKKVIPDKIQSRLRSVYKNLQKALFGFVKAKFKLTLITAATVLIGLLIMRVKHALTITLLIWFVDFLPYIGAALIIIPWVIYNLFVGDYTLAINLSILYGVIVVQRQIVKPRILSSSIGISPLATIFTMFVGFKLFGFLGIIIGPFTYIFIDSLYESNILKDLWNFIIGKKPANKPEVS